MIFRSFPRLLSRALLIFSLMLLPEGLSSSAYPRSHSARPGNATRANTPSPIPAGTIIPVSWDHTVSASDAQPGQSIEARVMQDVPLLRHDKIPAKAKVFGTIVSVVPPANGVGGKITFRFDKVEFHNTTIPVSVSLRTMAPYLDVQTAQTPLSGYGQFSGWATTVQIGGDIRYGDGGEVRNPQKQKVGKGVSGGVLVHIAANPALGCEGPVSGNDQLQALWVFSSASCGVYDLSGVQIAHSGATAPLGEVTLAKDKDTLKIEGATAMLLRVVQ
jgi:hypothetical protein